MPLEMSFTDAIIAVAVQLSVPFLAVCMLFMLFSWLRVIVDALSARNW